MQERNNRPPEPITLLIYPWNLSKTGDWSPDTGIYELRDRTPEELIPLLWENGIHVQNTAIAEIMAHGNPRKAAEVARALVKEHPIVEKSIRQGFGEEMGNFLLKVPLDRIPSRPQDYPGNIQVEFVQ